ncbi:MAG: hypothetical protein HOV80_15340 [Polyangiaceae bacterium]|nr:hypothetical protein [Polyangiaceae bacterium]
MRQALLSGGLIWLTACSDVVVRPDEGASYAASGTAASSTVGAGGGSVEPHQIEIAVDGESGDELLVLLNEPDGTLVTSWPGSALPVETVAAAGQIVTFAYATSLGNEQIETIRVTPEINRIERRGTRPSPPCVEEEMQVVVHVPSVAGASTAFVRLGTLGGGSLQSLPGNAEATALGCAGSLEAFDVLVVAGESTYQAFELIEDVPFEPRTTVEISPTFATAPRSTMTIEVDAMGDAMGAWGRLGWEGESIFAGSTPGRSFSVHEPALEAEFRGNAPFTYAPGGMNLPHGFQLARVEVDFPPTSNACGRYANLVRSGRSTQPIAFHATALGEPTIVDDTWQLGPGEVGTVVRAEGGNRNVLWQFMDDPARPAGALVFPSFPASLPDGFELPAEPPALIMIVHERHGSASYAEEVASSQDVVPLTYEARSTLVCPF